MGQEMFLTQCVTEDVPTDPRTGSSLPFPRSLSPTTFYILPGPLHPVWSWVAGLLTAFVPGCELLESLPQVTWIWSSGHPRR